MVGRDDFEFRVIDQRYVALYLTNVTFDMTKIEAAVNLIYALDETLRASTEEGNYVFTPELVADISKDLAKHQLDIVEALKHLTQAKNTMTAMHLDKIQLKLAKGVIVASNDNRQVQKKYSCRQWADDLKALGREVDWDCPHDNDDLSNWKDHKSRMHKAEWKWDEARKKSTDDARKRSKASSK